ncbi:MAG: hypothetical protein HC806_03565 [Anaerolineae bacterium]|nr:hypothetical protein [Anaerolineae bacterium]
MIQSPLENSSSSPIWRIHHVRTKKTTQPVNAPADATPGREVVDPSAEFPLGDEKKSETKSDTPEQPPSEKTIADKGKKSIPPIPTEAVSKPESKTRQFFRSFLRWTGAALIIFGLGALAAILLFYIPKSSQLKQVDQDLAAANITISELQTEVSDLNDLTSELENQKLH